MRKETKINRITNIPLSTVYDNIKKIKKNNTVNRKQGSGRPRKITGNFFKFLEQTIWRDTSILTRTLAKKLGQTGVEVSYMTILRYLNDHGYKKALLRPTPILTDTHKQKQIE